MRRVAALGFVALGVAAAAGAAGPGLGPIRLVTGEDRYCQFDPLLAPLRSGGFAVAWDNLQPPSATLLRLADSSGRLGPAVAFAGRRLEALGSDGAGNLVLLLRGAEESYFLQRLSASGQPLGAEIRLPVDAPFRRVAMAVAPDGRVAVVWHKGELVSGGWFGAQGPVGDVFEIDRAPFPLAGFSRPAAAVDAAGQLVAAWSRQSTPGLNAPQQVHWRRFDAAGHALGAAVVVRGDGQGLALESSPSLAGIRGGGVAVAWERRSDEISASKIFLRRFDVADKPLEPPVEVGFGHTPRLVSADGDRLALISAGSLWLVPAAPLPPPQAFAFNPENARYPQYFHTGDAATFLVDGRLAVAWGTYYDVGVIPTGCETAGIFQRVIDPVPVAGVPQPVGPEIFLAGQTTYTPELVRTPDGWMALWESGTCHAVVSRALDAAGQPRGPEFEVAAPSCSVSAGQRELSLAALPGGGFVAAWEEQGVPDPRIRLRLLGSDGRPLALAQQAGSPGARWPRLAAGSQGFVLGWTPGFSQGAVAVQPFDVHGVATGDPIEIGQSSFGLLDLVTVPGGFVAAWNHTTREIRSRRLGPTGAPVGEAVVVVADDELDQVYPHLAPDAGGGFAVAWTERTERYPFGFGARLRRFGPDDRPREEMIEVENLQDFGDREEESLLVEDLAASRDGVLLVVLTKHRGTGYQGDVYGVSVHDGVPVGPAMPIAATEPGTTGYVSFASAASDGCDWLVGWSAAKPVALPRNRVRRLAGACPGEAPALALGGGRFKVELLWHTPDGASSFGRAVALRNDTGAFWFFGADNPELMLKVLDGRGVNGAFWVFYATLTDVAFDLVVTDTATGARKLYSKPQGRLESRADVTAFPAAATANLATAVPATPRWLADQAGEDDVEAGCSAGETALCLDARFLVSVRFVDPRDGVERQALAVPMTASGGAFWFFSPDNLELMVKALDGRPVNGSFWFFAAGLSDLDYEITVTDTATGGRRVYRNRRGSLASWADTGAFP